MRTKAKMRMPNEKTRLRRLRDKYGRAADDHRKWLAGGGLAAGLTGAIIWFTLARHDSKLQDLERENQKLKAREEMLRRWNE